MPVKNSVSGRYAPIFRERVYDAFVGYGSLTPTDGFIVEDDSAAEILSVIGEISHELDPMWASGDLSITIDPDSETSSVVLRRSGLPIGFYEGSCLWIAEDERGTGLAMPLILVAVLDRSQPGNPTVLPRGVEAHGYSFEGLAAHDRAFELLWSAGLNVQAALDLWENPEINGESIMKSTPTPHAAHGTLKEEAAFEFGPGRIKHTAIVPAGTRCAKLDGGGAETWVVDDLSFFDDKASMMYHDADHYGIRVDEALIDIDSPKAAPPTYRAPSPSAVDDSPSP